jgi:hypothetical protein
MNGRRIRGGPLVAGTWLVGLGLVFLVRDWAGWSWGEAWPLFVILVGIGSLVSQLAGVERMSVGAWSLAWPLAWIAVGIVLLMSTTGALGVEPGELIAQWWPIVLIAIGGWFLVAALWRGRLAPAEELDLPLGGATEARVRIAFGGGELAVERAPAGRLVAGTFESGVAHSAASPGVVELRPDTSRGFPWWDRPLHWRVGVTGEVPLDLVVESGASRSTLDRSETRLRRLELRTGASETRVLLPRSAGASTVRVESGAASVHLEVPEGVGARIRSRMALGSSGIDQARFPRSGDGYASPDWELAANRVEIDIQGGVGSVRVT